MIYHIIAYTYMFCLFEAQKADRKMIVQVGDEYKYLMGYTKNARAQVA